MWKEKQKPAHTCFKMVPKSLTKWYMFMVDVIFWLRDVSLLLSLLDMDLTSCFSAISSFILSLTCLMSSSASSTWLYSNESLSSSLRYLCRSRWYLVILNTGNCKYVVILRQCPYLERTFCMILAMLFSVSSFSVVLKALAIEN